MYYCASEINVNEEIKNGYHYCLVKCNLTNMDLVKEILVFHKITYVVHFATQSHVQNSFNDSMQFIMDNMCWII